MNIITKNDFNKTSEYIKGKKHCVYLNFYVVILLTFLFSLILAYVSLWYNFTPIKDSSLIPYSRYEAVSNFLSLENGKQLFLLNFFPVLTLNFLLLFLFNNIIISNGITSVIILGLSVVNVNKIEFRQSPLFHYDFALVVELFGIIKSFPISFLLPIFLVIILGLAFIILAASFIRNKKPNILVRVIGIASILIIAFFTNKTVYTSAEMFSKFPVEGNIYNPVNDYIYKGFIYSFIHNYADSKMSKPENYSAKKVKKNIVEMSKTLETPYKKPHIIMIQSEAYSDIGINPHINFDGYDDPYKYFKEIYEDSVNGNLIVANVGGGTSDTEFDILTAMNTRFFRGVPYSNMLVVKPLSALPSLLENIGYNSYAIHPGEAWFYNRANVYPDLGFSKFYDISEFDQTKTKGMYITEEQNFDFMIKKFKENLAENPEQSQFEFDVTIQNHGPFFGKYLAETNFNTDLTLDPKDVDALSNYFVGVKDTDIELKKLTDYFNSIDEPVIVAFWGDHQPSFSPQVYTTLLQPKDDSNDVLNATYLNQVPFFVWENNYCKKSNHILKNIHKNGFVDGSTMSDFYLAPLILDGLGLKNTEYYIDYANDLRKEYPILLEKIFFDKNGNKYKYLTNDKVDFFIITIITDYLTNNKYIFFLMGMTTILN